MRWRRGGWRSRSGLWDEEIDGEPFKPDRRSPGGKSARRSRVTLIVWTVCLASSLLLALIMAAELVERSLFWGPVSAVNRRASSLGGGVRNGRRAFHYHVMVWFHGKVIDDRAMPEIVSIVRECLARGLGETHLSLDLHGTSVGDEGLRLLRGVAGLKSISIWDTKVTERGVQSLQESLPSTDMDARPPGPPNRR
jgi:hypothetical protein